MKHDHHASRFPFHETIILEVTFDMQTSNRKAIMILSFTLIVVMLGGGSVIMFISFLISLVWVSQGRKGATSPGVQLASD